MLLKDKVVVVSGIGPGLGQAIAVQAARAGADLVLAARTQSRLEEVAKEVTALGRRAVTVPTDITDPQAAQDLVQASLEAFGRVDTLVNNAFAMPTMRDLLKVDLLAFRESFETNVLATLRLTQLFAPTLVESKGSIVMVLSAVLRHSRRTFGTYKMAKTSLLSLAQSLSAELGPQGVRVNSVAPSYIWADTLKTYFDFLGTKKGVTGQQIYDEIAATIDLRRLIEPAEIADTVVFLASDMARAVTGQCLDVNGGEFHH
ncbi:short-chain dehydrogenase [Rhizocola hellebori]|uniref:Short-chain dehydrogenase n=1 Tax=Rhizocola hellebori TaxID=1392758 RepID=A0A8J3VIJ7_9ACTN|nr:SDR family oxidoreductase [Rhizocola hellebori]GIH07136.1 short-chain dehydrogenase [Rhizocola hellebori]